MLGHVVGSLTEAQARLRSALIDAANQVYAKDGPADLPGLLFVLADVVGGYIAEDPPEMRAVFLRELDRAIAEYRVHSVPE
jgi:hypothetical protein